MIKVLGLGGEPASGKTSLFKMLLNCLGRNEDFKFGLVRGYTFKSTKVIVLGIYNATLFSGTDRLSMAVQTDAMKFITYAAGDPGFEGYSLLFEGDRLFNEKFIRHCLSSCPGSRFMVVKSSAEEKERRHRARGDNQTERWLKSRQTKIANIVDKMTQEIELYNNENSEDQRAIFDVIVEFIHKVHLDHCPSLN